MKPVYISEKLHIRMKKFALKKGDKMQDVAERAIKNEIKTSRG